MDMTGIQKFGLIAIFLMIIGTMMVLTIFKDWDKAASSVPIPAVWAPCGGTLVTGTYQAANAKNYPVRLCITPRLTP